MPGTPLFEKLKRSNRIIDYNWSHYDWYHVVFTPLKMSEERLLNGLNNSWKEFYSYGSVYKRIGLFHKKLIPNLITNLVFKHKVNEKDFYSFKTSFLSSIARKVIQYS